MYTTDQFNRLMNQLKGVSTTSTKMVSYRMPLDILTRLEKESSKTGKKKTQIVVEALNERFGINDKRTLGISKDGGK